MARLKWNFGYQNPRTKKVDEWVKQHPVTPTPELIGRASAVIDRILGKNSELRDLWEEDASEWMEAVEDLRRRVGT